LSLSSAYHSPQCGGLTHHRCLPLFCRGEGSRSGGPHGRRPPLLVQGRLIGRPPLLVQGRLIGRPPLLVQGIHPRFNPRG
jgi:hypothetical protein